MFLVYFVFLCVGFLPLFEKWDDQRETQKKFGGGDYKLLTSSIIRIPFFFVCVSVFLVF